VNDAVASLTVWPGIVVSEPTIPVFEARPFEEDTIVFGRVLPLDPEERPEDAYTGDRRVALETDFYLREFCDLDASDPQAVLAFCQAWGPVGNGQYSDLHGASRNNARKADARVAEPWSHFMPNLDATRKLPLQDQFGLVSQTKERLPGLLPVTAHSVGRVAVYQASLANAVALWRYISDEISAEELTTDWRTEDDGVGLSHYINQQWDLPYEVTKETAVADLADHLNPALVAFHMRLEPRGATTPLVNVYRAACLQFANHITDGAPYGHCANETCGRLFSRQRGRGESDQHRTKGVRYCSATCARAQAQRQVRRRKHKQ
jgi:hypothetical protein